MFGFSNSSTCFQDLHFLVVRTGRAFLLPCSILRYLTPEWAFKGDLMINQGICFFGQSHTCNSTVGDCGFLISGVCITGSGRHARRRRYRGSHHPRVKVSHRLLESFRSTSLRLGTGRQLLETQPDSAHAWCTWNV